MKSIIQPMAELEQVVFFQRLVEWKFKPRATEVFNVMLNRPLSELKPDFSRQVYERLVDHLLIWLNLPGSDSAKEWEWRELYRLDQEIDPFYFSEGKIHRLLNQWAVFNARQKQLLISILSGYFQLRQGDFPSRFPSPVVSNHECQQWTRIFPSDWSWQSLDVLRRSGLLPMASRRGFTAYTRFALGDFTPDLTPISLRKWQSICWEAAVFFEENSDDPFAAHRTNHLAAAFAGRFNMMGMEGPCGDIPECDNCPLSSECRWYNTPEKDRGSPTEIMALVRSGQTESMPTDQLLQGLLNFSLEEREYLKERMAGSSLRTLASMPSGELRTFFGPQLAQAEQMQILFELCKRFNEERMTVGEPFATAWDIFRHFRMRLRDLKQEMFIAVLLNNRKQYINDVVITKGTLNSSPVHPREVFNPAIRESAACVVIVHNHPSGDPRPSEADLEVTRNLIGVGELVGIPIIDHIVIADDRYISLLEEGLL